MLRNKFNRKLFSMMAVSSLLITSCSIPVGLDTKGFRSPEEVFETLQVAMAKQDFAKVYDCLDEELQLIMLGGQISMGLNGAIPNASSEDKDNYKEKTKEILEAHGLDDNHSELQKALMSTDTDELGELVESPRKLFVELMEAAKPYLKEGNEWDGELQDVKIDGNSATAVIYTFSNGVSNSAPIRFKRKYGLWKIMRGGS